MKVLILSDLHLGGRASRAPALLEPLRKICRQYDRVILNGDTLDRYETAACEAHDGEWRRKALEYFRSRSGEPELISGNHDPIISQAHWLYLQTSQTLVFHGDCISDCTHPSRRSDQLLARRLQREWSAIGGRPTDFGDLLRIYRQVQIDHLREFPNACERRSALHYIADVFIPPHRPLHVLQYWHKAPRLMARMAASFKPKVRHVVVGHTHRPGHWTVDGVQVFNTGSYMPLSKPLAIHIDGDQVALVPVQTLIGKDE